MILPADYVNYTKITWSDANGIEHVIYPTSKTSNPNTIHQDSDGEYLLDDGIREINGSVLYMLQEMQTDIDDLYNEASASAFQSSYFPVARIDSGSFGDISSSGLITMMTASIGGGIFTSASLAAGGGGNADFSSVGEDIIPDSDNARDLGSKSKEFKNLYIDGVAHIDSLAGTTLTAPIRTLYRQVTAMKTTTLDAQSTDVFEFNISKPVTVDLITPLFAGQEITIMNIGAGAVTITRSQGGKATSIYNAKGASLTINQHEAYKFVSNRNQLWYVIS